MTKLLLLKRSSKIHAVKCNKTTAETQAFASSDRLNELLKQIAEATEDQLEKISDEVNRWAGSSPIATERDIQELFKK